MSTACIEWAAGRDANGYGRKLHDGKNKLAHRLAYCEAHGCTLESIVGIVVRHTCDNPPCINPEHLVLGTHQDNMDDMMKRSRHRVVSSTGESNGQSKLTAGDVLTIRATYVPHSIAFSGQALASRFGVSTTTISKVITNKTWRTV